MFISDEDYIFIFEMVCKELSKGSGEDKKILEDSTALTALVRRRIEVYLEVKSELGIDDRRRNERRQQARRK